MKCLSIQIDLTKAQGFDQDEFLFLLRGLGRFPEVDKVGTATIAFNLFSEDLPALWQELWGSLYEGGDMSAVLKRSSIVACEGENEEDLFLYHFDSSEQIDKI